MAKCVHGLRFYAAEGPLRGVKRSGYGRELSDLGMREFMNAKTVWIGQDASRPPGAGRQLTPVAFGPPSVWRRDDE